METGQNTGTQNTLDQNTPPKIRKVQIYPGPKYPIPKGDAM